jgi:putative FmdB family regulatory protein
MPLFEYACNNCHYRFDKMVGRWDAEVKCPVCRSDVKKLMSAFAVGASHNKGAVDGLSEIRPKMCTNC